MELYMYNLYLFAAGYYLDNERTIWAYGMQMLLLPVCIPQKEHTKKKRSQ